MDKNMRELCKEYNVAFFNLCEKLQAKIEGEHPDCYLSADEARVCLAALEVAGGL